MSILLKRAGILDTEPPKIMGLGFGLVIVFLWVIVLPTCEIQAVCTGASDWAILKASNPEPKRNLKP